MHIWVDDVRTPPCDDWLWARSVNEAITAIKFYERNWSDDSICISLDHDAGDFAKDGGDYIRILDWLEKEGIVDNANIMKKTPNLILTREPFLLDDELRDKVVKWVEWANKADPSEYDPFAKR